MSKTCKHGIPLGITCGYCVLFESNEAKDRQIQALESQLSEAMKERDAALEALAAMPCACRQPFQVGPCPRCKALSEREER